MGKEDNYCAGLCNFETNSTLILVSGSVPKQELSYFLISYET